MIVPPPPRLDSRTTGAVNCRRWWIHLILVGAYVLFIGVMGMEHRQTRLHFPALTHTPAGLLLVSASELLIFALVFSLALFASQASRDDLLLRWRGGFWPVPLGIGYSVAIRLAIAILMMAAGTILFVTHIMSAQSLQEFVATHRPNYEALVDVSAMRQNPLYFWLVLTLVSFLVAGLREELWRSAFLAGLRALWPRSFDSRTGQIAAVAVAAIVFGFGHLGMGLFTVLITGIIGFGLGLIMIFHRSIWPAVIAHGMFDASSLAMLPWVADRLQDIQRTAGH